MVAFLKKMHYKQAAVANSRPHRPAARELSRWTAGPWFSALLMIKSDVKIFLSPHATYSAFSPSWNQTSHIFLLDVETNVSL